MNSALVRLIEAMPPPAQPIGNDGDWTNVERKFGLRFPDDYKEFISIYGTGGFLPFELWVGNHLTEEIDVDFRLGQNEFAHDAESFSISFVELSKTTPLFPWGWDGVANEYFWGMDGPPENWYVIVTAAGLTYYRFPELSFTEFLLELLVEMAPQLRELYSPSIFTVDHQFVTRRARPA